MAASAARIELSRAAWRKSTWSSAEGQNCVEVAINLPGLVAVRDSKQPTGQVLAVGPREWATFIASVKVGVFEAA